MSKAKSPTATVQAAPPTPPPSAPAGLIPRQEDWVDLPEPYVGMQIRIWSNFSQRVWAEIQSGDSRRIEDALVRLVLAHRAVGADGVYVPWSDEEGEIPQPVELREVVEQEVQEDGSTRERVVRSLPFWDRIPKQLAQWIVSEVKAQGDTLPNGLTASSRS